MCIEESKTFYEVRDIGGDGGSAGKCWRDNPCPLVADEEGVDVRRPPQLPAYGFFTASTNSFLKFETRPASSVTKSRNLSDFSSACMPNLGV